MPKIILNPFTGNFDYILAGSVGTKGLALEPLKIKTNLVNGNNLINHKLEAQVAKVVVFDSANEKIDVDYNLVDSDNLNINIAGGGPINNVTIYVFSIPNLLLIAENKPIKKAIQLNVGNNIINHNLNADVTDVKVFDINGNSMDLEYDLVDQNNVNILLPAVIAVSQIVYIYYKINTNPLQLSNQSLSHAASNINHNLNAEVTDVIVFDANNNNVKFDYSIVDSNNINMHILPNDGILNNLTIYIFYV